MVANVAEPSMSYDCDMNPISLVFPLVDMLTATPALADDFAKWRNYRVETP